MTSKELAKIAYNALDDKKGVNITIIDISEISIIADYFIIAVMLLHRKLHMLMPQSRVVKLKSSNTW